MSHNQEKTTQDFNYKKNYEEQIYKLKNKLIRYDEILAKKDELHNQLNDLKRWIENVEIKEKQMNNDLLNDLGSQTKKLKKAKEAEAILQAEKKELLNRIDRKTEEISILKQNEENLLIEIEELNMNKKQMQNELSKSKSRIEENNCTIERLTKVLKSKEEEYLDIKRQLNECRAVSCRQNETCKDLEKEIESTNTKLTDAKFQITLNEEKLRLERETLTNELEMKCQRLRTMQIEYDEAKQIIDEETLNVRTLETQVVNLRELNENDWREANVQTERLKKKNSAKDESVLRVKNQISKLARENECISSYNSVLNSQIQEKKCLLEKMKLAIKMLNQIKISHINQLEREKNALECDIQKKKKIIDDSEQELCSLRDKIKNSELYNCLQKRDICCLRKKINEFESKYNNCFLPVKSVFNCSRDKDDKERELNSDCPTNLAAAPKTCDDGCENNDGCILNELKQMYSDLGQLKDAHLAKDRLIN